MHGAFCATITTPLHAVDCRGLRQLELHPASRVFLFGNPAVVIAVEAVVDVGELVFGMVWKVAT